MLPAHYLEDEAILQFLGAVNNSFKNFEKSIKLADHAFNVSEREYVTVTDDLRLQNEIKQRSISQLKEAIKALNPGSVW